MFLRPCPVHNNSSRASYPVVVCHGGPNGAQRIEVSLLWFMCQAKKNIQEAMLKSRVYRRIGGAISDLGIMVEQDQSVTTQVALGEVLYYETPVFF